MDKQQLQERLELLHAELQQTKSIDPRGQKTLQQLSADIRELLEHGGEHETHKYSKLGERLRDGVEHFEASHPKATMLMGQVIDILAKMGI